MSQLPFGLWDSPLQPRFLARSRTLRGVAWTGDGHGLVWLEGRGDQGVLVFQADPAQAPRDLDPTLSVRAQVNGGGGDFAVSRGGRVYFVERSGRLYRQDLVSGPARSLTPPFGQAASPCLSRDGQWLVYVHTCEGVDRLVIADARGDRWPQVLAAGADFYMQPAWHPSGRLLAWVEWDHPQMPWDGTRLVLARLSRRGAGLPQMSEQRVLAGSERIAVFQPEFSPDGRYLACASDPRGWSELWLYDLEEQTSTCLVEGPGEVALPAWSQGLRALSFSADSRRLYFTRGQDGCRTAFCCQLDTRQVAPVPELAEYTWVEQLTASPRGQGLACIASSSQVPPRVLRLDQGRLHVHARATAESIPPAGLALPQHLSWTAAPGHLVHGLYYPPTSLHCSGAGLPPAILMVHGGPNSQAHTGFNPRNQFFATRGYAVLDVNYRGSTGYGRPYMEALRGQWGVADLEDTLSGAQHLVELGLADPRRLVVMGSSAGGYTVLRALTVHPGFFRAGICVYGIADLFALAAGTHKFEERYLDSLLGPLPAAGQVYRDRSPLFAAEQVRDPVIVFHGAEDKVVPIAQAEALVDSLRRRQVPHEYHVYAGEGHGWRQPETVEAFYQSAEAFLRQHVLFA